MAGWIHTGKARNAFYLCRAHKGSTCCYHIPSHVLCRARDSQLRPRDILQCLQRAGEGPCPLASLPAICSQKGAQQDTETG